MKYRTAIIAGVVAVALGALVLLFATSPSGEDSSTSADSPIEGKLAPPLSGTALDGEAFDLDKERGRWVLVNFFATWCPPCVQEHPELVRFSEEAGERAVVVSVAFDDTPERIQEFFAENGGDWPVLANDSGDVSIEYGVVKLPESFLVNPEGVIVEKLAGGVTATEINEIIAAHDGDAPSGG